MIQVLYGVYRLFVLSFPDDAVRIGDTECLMSSAEMKDCNVMIDTQILFD